VVKPAPTGPERVTEFVASGIEDEAAALNHVRSESPAEAAISKVAAISDSELIAYGVPAGRTAVIPYAGKGGDVRAAEKRLIAQAFLGEWVADNVEASANDDVATARTLTSKLFAEASNRGIDVDELSSAAGGNVEDLITKALKKTT
jgi:hypothetical protein